MSSTWNFENLKRLKYNDVTNVASLNSSHWNWNVLPSILNFRKKIFPLQAKCDWSESYFKRLKRHTFYRKRFRYQFWFDVKKYMIFMPLNEFKKILLQAIHCEWHNTKTSENLRTTFADTVWKCVPTTVFSKLLTTWLLYLRLCMLALYTAILQQFTKPSMLPMWSLAVLTLLNHRKQSCVCYSISQKWFKVGLKF